MASASNYAAERRRMVSEQIAARGIRDARVLAALGRVPRHCFVPLAQRAHAYEDHPLPIGHSQTISQPYMVALMTEVVRPQVGDRVLEVGTGSGYQAAVLAELGAEVFTIERHAELSLAAKEALLALGYGERVHLRVGDGEQGWPEAAPFTAIVVTAAARRVPRELLQQLGPAGCLVLPLGEAELQGLARIRRSATGWEEEYFGECRFVRLVGADGWDES
ncbi:MAG: protein-L-isoaspartate(D-aspartate) O-methyltransferase [Deltaproteobacteria bacterium]|nr:protein-L-isoaspartate(D-aspartate) O-methyltransferase [Deltaproteobacteria bacterium]MBI3390044.1 protein-L-isoaspartate(D-aspartate) O-methyltransferase [Deltaproteobacteria bacterium]